MLAFFILVHPGIGYRLVKPGRASQYFLCVIGAFTCFPQPPSKRFLLAM